MNVTLSSILNRLANRPALVLAAGLLSAAPAFSGDTPAMNEDGLPRVDSKALDTVYLAEQADFSGFEQVFVARPDVDFRKNWQRDQNRYDPHKVKDRDVERIQGDMADLLQDIISKEFSGAGYALAEAPGPGVLVLEPAIVDLDVTAPDVPDAVRTFTFSESAGAMTLQLRGLDGATGTPLLDVSDRKRDPRRGWMEWRTRPYNTAVARRLMKAWAKDVRQTVQEAPQLAAND